MNEKQMIGVFDSGVGGLTVLKDLIDKFPQETFIYVGDEKNCPYGIKTKEEIKICIFNIINYFINKDVKVIVIACNTASCFIDEIRKMTQIPIISVIEPTAMEAIKKTKTKRVGVIATSKTIEIGRYSKILTENNCEDYSIPCSEFVEIIENDLIQTDESSCIFNNKLNPLKNKIDTLILGCTHFPLIRDQIQQILGKINYIESGSPTANLLERVLKENNILNQSNEKGDTYIYLTKKNKYIYSYLNKLGIRYQSIERIDI